MPTEHEYKFVVHKDIERFRENPIPKGITYNKYLIRQGYLAFSKGMTTRIRCLQKVGPDGRDKKKWYLTFKQKSNSGRVIEIEKKLDGRDGSELWDICVGKLKKERFSFDNGNVTWELDFFLNHNQVYFVLVEAELPEGESRPEMPSFLQPFLLYKAELEDDRFSNKRLGDVDYSTKIYKELLRIYGEHDDDNDKRAKGL